MLVYRQTDVNVHNFVSSVNQGQTTQSNSFYLKIPICKTSAIKTSFFNMIIKLWNFTCKFATESSFSSIAVFKNILTQNLTCLLQTTFYVECPCTWSLVHNLTTLLTPVNP